MESILKFNLPEDEQEFKQAVNGKDMEYKISEFYEDVIRKLYKYNQPKFNNNEDMLEYIRQEYIEHFNEFIK